MLEKILKVSHVGRFQYLQVNTKAVFPRCTLVFGENGWGKSTLADVMRAVGSQDGAPVMGRQTLGANAQPSIELLFEKRPAKFDNGSWSGYTPKVAVYDSAFVNSHVFSGDFVEREHLTRQAALVLGEDGVRKAQRISEIDKESDSIPPQQKKNTASLAAVIKTIDGATVSVDEFCSLSADGDLPQQIANKEREVASALNADKIASAIEPKDYPVPTASTEFTKLLSSSLGDVASDALLRVRQHIEKHDTAASKDGPTHEQWLDQGRIFEADDECPYCGQGLDDRALVDSYAKIFSAAYRELSQKVSRTQQTFARYSRGDFRAALEEVRAHNEKALTAWKALTGFELSPDLSLVSTTTALEASSLEWAAVFERKLSDLVQVIEAETCAELATSWDACREQVLQVNANAAAQRASMKVERDRAASASSSKLKSELAFLKAQARRQDSDVSALVDERASLEARKKQLSDEKAALREALKLHAETITKTLGKTINHFLERLNAGFSISYDAPDFKGREPAASYSFIINSVAVPARAAKDQQGPNFGNTLSGGDKSTLALALFLATVNADPNLSETIIVLDDPFTSLDEFRRTFTANEIFKLSKTARQVIVLSHDKNFLRLLWDRVDRSSRACLAVQAGAPGISSLNVYDIEAATMPRTLLERQRVEDYLEGGEHDPADIRKTLRSVLETFYRAADLDLFLPDENLDGIIRKVREQGDSYKFKGALEDLELINAYTRPQMHGPIDGNPIEGTNENELKKYCKMALALTRGM